MLMDTDVFLSNKRTELKSYKKRKKKKNIYHKSTWSMPHFSQNGFVICPLFRTMANFDCVTISTTSHHVYVVTDAI